MSGPFDDQLGWVGPFSTFVWSFHVGGGGEKFVFARRGNLGFAFEKLLVAPQRRIAAAFSPIHFFIYTHPPSWRDSARVDTRLMIGAELNTFFLAPAVDTPRVDTDPS